VTTTGRKKRKRERDEAGEEKRSRELDAAVGQ
jgi:hypothetical protein